MNENSSEEVGLRPVTPSIPAVPDAPMPVESLLMAAVERGATVETLEKLLALSERVKAERARTAFFEALSAFQAECPVIPKTKTASGGGSYSYKYAPLDVIVATVSPLLREHGLSYRFDTAFEESPPAQVVTCIVHHRDGHSESSVFRTPVDAGARMNDMQKSASAQTYAKRYAFCNALGILTGDEDNDGHGAGRSHANTPPRPAASAPTRVGDTPAERRPAADSGGDLGRSVPRPLGRNVVRIQRPSQGSQGSDEPGRVNPGSTAVAETPATPENDADARKAELRQRIIEGEMALLRTITKYADFSEKDLWDRAAEVADQWCQMGFSRPLLEMSRVDLERAKQRMDDTVRERTGAVA